jgi:ElaB/YqjD/DUF883 family membrane-anchored ribosome-binding protein
MANRLAEYERALLPQGARRPAGQSGAQTTQQRIGSLFQQASRWIVQHPEIALTTALVTGVVLGWLIKRR